MLPDIYLQRMFAGFERARNLFEHQDPVIDQMLSYRGYMTRYRPHILHIIGQAERVFFTLIHALVPCGVFPEEPPRWGYCAVWFQLPEALCTLDCPVEDVTALLGVYGLARPLHGVTVVSFESLLDWATPHSPLEACRQYQHLLRTYKESHHGCP